MPASYAAMTSGKLTQAKALHPATDDAWAELCGVDGGDDEEFERQEANYGSLMGLGVRKPVKKPVLVLDPEVAEKAAQVMEINAGQLIVNPDKSGQGFAWPGFDPLDEDEEPLAAFEAGEDEEDEEAQAAVAEWLSRETFPEEADADEELDEVAQDECTPEEDLSPAGLSDAEPEPGWWGAEEGASEPDSSIAEEITAPVDETDEGDEAELPFDQPVFVQPAFEWALGAPGAPPVPDVACADEAGDFARSDEPEPLLQHTTAADLPEPEGHGHELRVMIAQLTSPRKSQGGRRLSIMLRRFYRWLRRLIAS